MREHPLLMQGPLVRATLAGRKTQTRRPVKMPSHGIEPYSPGYVYGALWNYSFTEVIARCPMGQAGDRLWVRETYKWADAKDDGVNQSVVVAYRADDKASDIECSLAVHDGVVCAIESEEVCGERWRPSIHMPRWACRLVLPLVSVRVERVQDITEDDARAEGLRRTENGWTDGATGYDVTSARAAFQELWASIYGEASWDANPWVWVAEWDHAEVSK
mgnify:CR=1 FL=1